MQTSPGRSERTDRIDRPRFRQDLVAELIDDQGARFIDVMDPDSGSLFRFYEVEYSLACGMDGERDIPGIVKWAQDELGLSPSQHEVRSVIAQLGELGFIDTGETTAESPAYPDSAPSAPELARSIVVGAPGKPAPSTELELGAAGTAAPSRRDQARPAPELELGAPGGGARRAAESIDGVALGAPGARAHGQAGRQTRAPSPEPEDVSLDLSEHIAVRPDDVKEAVRASKIMTAVEPPRDLMPDKPSVKASSGVSRSADRPADVVKPPPDLPFSRPPDPRALEPRAPEPRIPEPRAHEPWPLDAPPAARSDVPASALRSTKPPVELPKAPPMGEQTAIAHRPDRGGGSGLLVALLILVLLAGAAVVLWKFVLDKPETVVDTSSLSVPVTPVKPVPPPPAPPPPAPTSKIAMETPSPDDIKTTRAGQIETILADKSVVKDHDVVVKLVGDKPIEAERAGLMRDQKRLQDQIDAATKKLNVALAAGNKNAETAAQNELAAKQTLLAAKQGQLATKTADLDKFLLYAPSAGTFTPAAKLGQKVALDLVVARLQRDATPFATFKLPDTKPFSVNMSVDLAVGAGDLHLACAVTEVQPDGIKVACPPDPVLVEGADVTLKLPAAPARMIDTPPASAGSGSAEAPTAAPAAPAASAGSAQ